ncbi:hypothetical protein P168DRAFT_293806 [Aspergillus campestris IBT 28561]|uniref:Oxidoreductase-like domain-containing protein n=1 Tax=Aspergillus campestris (strain IBT 28561) TaxID=1392248 RepID=A0A2I1CQM5_ASPC2|nr:uncharacterized protein P168DRAFT_293806 [Aspergillus campestris IBT 28561]PKX99924.1 hypothetical protein P168DRAFT_293806 [Aspergillus campestris IBT 28561]
METPLVVHRHALVQRGACLLKRFSTSPNFPSRFAASALYARRRSALPPLRTATTASHDRTTSQHPNQATYGSGPSQAHPLTGYYSDIIANPSPYRAHAKRLRPVNKAAEKPTQKEPAEQSPQEKMSVVFGTRLAGPGRNSRYNPGEMPPESTWKTVNGVPIPPRPEEPDNCCMSGCVNCVWDNFRDEMEEWAERVVQAKAKASEKGPTKDLRQSPRKEVQSASTSMDDDGGGSDTNWTEADSNEDIFANIPVGIREFMKTEKKLKLRHQQEASS